MTVSNANQGLVESAFAGSKGTLHQTVREADPSQQRLRATSVIQPLIGISNTIDSSYRP